VEKDRDLSLQIKNMEWTIRIAKQNKLHLDFHIDYNLDPDKETTILQAVDLLFRAGWPSNAASPDFRTIVFGHCTRLTLFDANEWLNLQQKLQDLPVSFVGLPTSDLFMMGRPNTGSGGGQVSQFRGEIPSYFYRFKSPEDPTPIFIECPGAGEGLRPQCCTLSSFS
jgi:hypothetical protein